ncbi:hypothetical protein [Luteitalea sp.]|uniref:hypothetical protein n=1 Tax=Luteitalea sp. TaxID=2004800 RepID=UPI0025C0EA05|nr:hypothetical protein [Luteitalea sp.]
MTTSRPDLPSSRQLLRATLVALTVASVMLVAIVLPAEYGIDPLGTGRATGLYRPPADATVPATTAASAAPTIPALSRAVLERSTPFRTDEMTVTLESGEGVEVKAAMQQGERLVFSWTTSGGGVDVDMHGEVAGAADEAYTSYVKGEGRTSGHGTLDAPVTGHHGWFWQNLNDTPVTVTVKVSGFYEQLFRP